MYIVFEGVDCCGKTTQSKLLSLWLNEQGIPHIGTSEPSKTEIGGAIRTLVEKESKLSPLTEFLLFSADRMEHSIKTIGPARREKRIIISDRSYLSGIAYHVFLQGAPLEFIQNVNKWINFFPDLAFWIDVPEHVIKYRMKSRKKDPLDLQAIEKISRLIQGYSTIYQMAKLGRISTPIVRVDGNKSVEDVQSQVQNKLLEFSILSYK